MRSRSLLAVSTLALAAIFAPVAISPAANTTADQPTARQPDDAMARDMVFELTVSYDSSVVAQALQPGFLVETGGVGVTSYNALHTAKSAAARFRDDPEVYTVELLTAVPSLDVALVKLTPKKAGAAGLTRFLPLGVGDIRDQQPIWTLKSSVALDKSRAEAGLADVQRQGSAGAGRGGAINAPAWLRVSGKQDRRTPGCPLVDERGRLVGISVWAWPDSGAPPVALTAGAVDDLLNSYKEDAARQATKGGAGTAIPISQARSKYHDQRLVGSIFPQLYWGDSESTVSQATGAAKAFEAGAQCSACRGSGQVEKKIKTGTRRVGPGMTEDVFRTEMVTCTLCGGSKVADERQIWSVGTRLAQVYSGLRPGEEKNSLALEQLAATVGTFARSCSPDFVKRVNGAARDHLDLKKLRRGEAVMFVGRFAGDPTLESWDQDVQRVEVDGSREARVLVVGPEKYRLESGERAFFVGVVSGFVTADQNANWVVLEHVTAVPFSAKASR